MSRKCISPTLSIAIARLNSPTGNHFATWVFNSVNASDYVHHDCIWPESLSQLWQAWLEMFSPDSLPLAVSESAMSDPQFSLPPLSAALETKPSYSSRLMQQLGIDLWQWLFQGAIQSSFHRCQGLALGQKCPLRIRLDVRSPNLIPLPWEIMQSQAGQPAISLSPRLLFSRTTCDVQPLSDRPLIQALNILLVLGHNDIPQCQTPPATNSHWLELEKEASQIAEVLANTTDPGSDSSRSDRLPCFIKTLIQPSVAQLITELETPQQLGQTPYNVIFYAGHGLTGPDGGLLFLQEQTTINGTELAQVLVRCGITLAVFNACWSAVPAMELSSTLQNITLPAIPSSSLAKVLIHHGVPAVLGMRDSITDSEALSFIQTFARALSERMPIDRAVAIARQQLLTLYKFNQPAWTLPILYMHPEFNGFLAPTEDAIRTQLPANSPTALGYCLPRAYLKLQQTTEEVTSKSWLIEAGRVQIGRSEQNDIVWHESWISNQHAEIFCRNGNGSPTNPPTYFLRDFSRYGTLVWEEQKQQWHRIHHQEVQLSSGTKLKFGSSQGRIWEFLIDSP